MVIKNISRVGKVKQSTPKVECLMGREFRKNNGRAGKRIKYKKQIVKGIKGNTNCGYDTNGSIRQQISIYKR
jgi:ribosomal protein S30